VFCPIAMAYVHAALTQVPLEINPLVTMSHPVYCIPVYVQFAIAVQYPVHHPHDAETNFPLLSVHRQR